MPFGWTPLPADVLAVCYETMHRAKTNIEILVGALDAEGYDFHPTVYSPYWRRSQRMREWVESYDEQAQLVVASLQEELTNLPEPVRGKSTPSVKPDSRWLWKPPGHFVTIGWE